MHEVVWQEGNSIEIIVWDELTRKEFKEVLHQLESLCSGNREINVMLDAGGLNKAEVSALKDEYDFYKKYQNHLARVALVTDDRFKQFLAGIFAKFSDLDMRVFTNEQTDEAREWIFPSRLPG